eukprot:CAMPEP_0117002684 /NCGR_PEP_ID=MMETSP0472-20121206/4266_1 /TAXON_ID=693140 ORGANISM="Tiarina fusus, Strain LIS" /NCGR_SAMPLE_ID=MMETSP0472 /ASSEMBLY_ACC=CAM_ASM_000603 /LENGTH=48 /DNA_ID= /DNA_START= /DNA_END= /DNA_ORIENTATION=
MDRGRDVKPSGATGSAAAAAFGFGGHGTNMMEELPQMRSVPAVLKACV